MVATKSILFDDTAFNGLARPDVQNFKFCYQIWIPLKISYMVAKETILFGHSAFYGLA
jgi:hypothetical protein